MEQRIDVLRKLLEERLLPLVDRDYVFLDLPYHPNVGDTLIAVAAMSLLKKASFHCLYSSSRFTYDKRHFSSDTLIIFNGGGNFGDLWKDYPAFRNSFIREYPDNHFLILPQSVCYIDLMNLESDVKLYSICGKRMTICARDKVSYDFLKKHFVYNTIILVPDLAFYIDKKFLNPVFDTGRVLYLKRKDKEYLAGIKSEMIPPNAEIHDWPTLEDLLLKLYGKYLRYVELSRSIRYYPKFFLYVEDFIWQKLIMPYYLRRGIKFVNCYDVIYSTRLHVAILGILLNKQVYFFDNSYKKNSSLYNTWLKDFSNITLVG